MAKNIEFCNENQKKMQKKVPKGGGGLEFETIQILSDPTSAAKMSKTIQNDAQKGQLQPLGLGCISIYGYVRLVWVYSLSRLRLPHVYVTARPTRLPNNVRSGPLSATALAMLMKINFVVLSISLFLAFCIHNRFCLSPISCWSAWPFIWGR